MHRVLVHWACCVRLRVRQLGCGTGLCGVVASRLGAAYVCLTDGAEDALAQCDRTLAREVTACAHASAYFDWGDVDGGVAAVQDCLVANGPWYVVVRRWCERVH